MFTRTISLNPISALRLCVQIQNFWIQFLFLFFVSFISITDFTIIVYVLLFLLITCCTVYFKFLFIITFNACVCVAILLSVLWCVRRILMRVRSNWHQNVWILHSYSRDFFLPPFNSRVSFVECIVFFFWLIYAHFICPLERAMSNRIENSNTIFHFQLKQAKC